MNDTKKLGETVDILNQIRDNLQDEVRSLKEDIELLTTIREAQSKMIDKLHKENLELKNKISEKDNVLSVDTLIKGHELSSRPIQRVINTSCIELYEENGRLNLRIKSLEDLLIFCHRSGILGMSYSEGLNQEVDYVYKSLKILSIDYSSDISEKDYEKYIQERLK